MAGVCSKTCIDAKGARATLYHSASVRAPVRASTRAYCPEIGAPQSRHFARKKIAHEMIGILSYQRIPASHRGQWLGGCTTESPAGTRKMTTFRKLPTTAPKTNAKPANSQNIVSIEVIIRRGTRLDQAAWRAS